MTLTESVVLSNKAHQKGYCVSVKNGKVQFQTVVFLENGKSIVTPHTDWLDYNEALEIIEQ